MSDKIKYALKSENPNRYLIASLIMKKWGIEHKTEKVNRPYKEE